VFPPRNWDERLSPPYLRHSTRNYNFARAQKALKGTPAMAAGLADHAWSIEEIVGLLDAAETKAA
jgi:hypothetical protein